MPEAEGRATCVTLNVTAVTTLKDGAVEIFMLNNGPAAATVTGSDTQGLTAVAINLPVNASLSLGYCGRGRKGVTITPGALSTVVVVMTF